MLSALTETAHGEGGTQVSPSALPLGCGLPRRAVSSPAPRGTRGTHAAVSAGCTRVSES